uniref:Uncharacterized protein n=1 Tax=Macrostomum lignano TaxID=282301 RepID=A0A1I8FP60_9PLAT
DSFKPALPRIAFKHQLYSLCLPPAACIDQELQQLRDSGRLRMFKNWRRKLTKDSLLMLSEEFEAFCPDSARPPARCGRASSLCATSAATGGLSWTWAALSASTERCASGFCGLYARTKFKEMLRSGAGRPALPQSSPPLEYMMHDLVGDGTLRAIDTNLRRALSTAVVDGGGGQACLAHTFAVFRGRTSQTPSFARPPSRMARTADGNSGHCNGSSGLSNSQLRGISKRNWTLLQSRRSVIIVEAGSAGLPPPPGGSPAATFLHKSAVLSALGPASCLRSASAGACGAAFAASSWPPLAPTNFLWACDPGVLVPSGAGPVSAAGYTLPYAKLSAPCVTVLRPSRHNQTAGAALPPPLSSLLGVASPKANAWGFASKPPLRVVSNPRLRIGGPLKIGGN